MKRTSISMIGAILGLVLALAGCGGGGGGGGDPVVETATLNGTIDRVGVPRVAARTLEALPANAGDVTVAAVNTAGAVVASVLVPAGQESFTLVVPVGATYLIQVRKGAVVLAVSDFAVSVPAGAGTLTLPILLVELGTGLVSLPTGATLPAPLTRAGTQGFAAAARALTDTDNDGLPDGAEIQLGAANGVGFNPAGDADGDGISNLDEVRAGTDPSKVDTDGDGLNDGAEVAAGTDPRLADTDGDGMSDGFEVANGFNPLSAADGTLDADGDGLSNAAEFAQGTDPRKADTDNDRLSDGREVAVGTNPLVPDSDGDGVLDGNDSFPVTNNRFAAFETVQLAGLTGSTFNTANAMNDADQAGLADAVGVSTTAGGVGKAVLWAVDTVVRSAGAPTTLQTLAGAPTGFSAAHDVNNNGRIVGQAENAAGAVMPVIWELNPANQAPGGPISALPVPVGTVSGAAYSINDAGLIAGEAKLADGTFRPLVWTVNPTTGAVAGPTTLPLLAGGTSASAFSIGDSNRVSGQADDVAGAVHGALWVVDATGLPVSQTDLGGHVGDVASTAGAINAATVVAGAAEEADGTLHAILWRLPVGGGATLFDIEPQAGVGSSANDVGPTGRIAGWMGRSAAGDTAVVWDAANTLLTATEPVFPAATAPAFSQAYGVNGGNHVVGMMEGTAGRRGFVGLFVSP
ncbi:MAG: hypothetical protein ACYDA8_05365 [Deferrisomatales bacterium]